MSAASHEAVTSSATAELASDGQFLLETLEEFECELRDDEVAREYYGHVSPALARFRAALTRLEPTP